MGSNKKNFCAISRKEKKKLIGMWRSPLFGAQSSGEFVRNSLKLYVMYFFKFQDT